MKIQSRQAPSLLQITRALLDNHATRLAVAPLVKSEDCRAIVYVQLSETTEAPYLIEFLGATILMTERRGQDISRPGDFYLDDPISKILEWLAGSKWHHAYFPVPITDDLVAHVVMCLGPKLTKRINFALMTAGMPDTLCDDGHAGQ